MGKAAPDGMRGVHGRRARWRNSHTGRLPIPEPLWDVARGHGVFRNAKAAAFQDHPAIAAHRHPQLESICGFGALRVSELIMP